MRQLLLFIALLSAPAFAACPNISGNFNCSDGTGSYSQSFTTAVDGNGVTIYTINDTQVITDGKPYPVPGTFMPNGKYTATCDTTGKVLVHAEGPFQWGSDAGYLKFDISAYLSGSVLMMGEHEDYLPVQGAERTSDTALTCTPAP